MKLPQLGFFVSSDHRDFFATSFAIKSSLESSPPTARRPTVFAVSSDIQRIILVCLQLHDPHVFACTANTRHAAFDGLALEPTPRKARLVSWEKHHLFLTLEAFVKLPVKFE